MTTDQNPSPAGEARTKPSSALRKVAVAVAGVVVILVGIPLIPLFGPGWLIVFSGLAILASEFAWAGRLHDWIRARFRSLMGSRTDQ